MSKALIAAALLALGVVSLLQQDTSAMAVPASGVQPAVATPAIAETVAYAEVARRPVASPFAIEALSEPTASQAHIGASRSGLVTLRFDLVPSRPEGPMSQPPSGPPWP